MARHKRRSKNQDAESSEFYQQQQQHDNNDNNMAAADDDEYESEDDNAKLLDETVDKQIFNVLNALKRNDPSIYDKGTRFFDAQELEKMKNVDKSQLVNQYFTYVGNEKEMLEKRQRALQSFHDAVDEAMTFPDNENDDGENDDDENDMGSLFKKKQKSKEDQLREEAAFQDFLNKEKRREKDTLLKQGASLERYESGAKLSNEDEFLRDYLMNNKWMIAGEDKSDSSKKNNNKKSKSSSFQELAKELRSTYDDNENGDDDDLDYDSDGMQRDREFEELERREQEEHLRSSKIPTLAEHRFEEKGADKLATYTYKSSEREKKVTAKVRQDLNRKENKKKAKEEAKMKAAEKTRQIQINVLQMLIELKKLIHGDGSVVDKLDLEAEYLEDEEKMTQVWDTVEDQNVVEQLLYGSIEDDYDEDEEGDDTPAETDPEKRKMQLRRQIQKGLSDYYDSFFTDADQEQTFKFKYKRVDKDDFGFTATDILALDDEDLEDILPINNIKRYNAHRSDDRTKQMVRDQIEKKLSRSDPASKPSRKRKRKTKKQSSSHDDDEHEEDEQQNNQDLDQEEDQESHREEEERAPASKSSLFNDDDDSDAGAFDDDFFSKKKRKIDHKKESDKHTKEEVSSKTTPVVEQPTKSEKPAEPERSTVEESHAQKKKRRGKRGKKKEKSE